MDRPQKTEEPAVQVVGFHVEGTQVPVPQGSEKATHGEEVTQNSSSVPYLPPALSESAAPVASPSSAFLLDAVNVSGLGNTGVPPYLRGGNMQEAALVNAEAPAWQDDDSLQSAVTGTGNPIAFHAADSTQSGQPTMQGSAAPSQPGGKPGAADRVPSGTLTMQSEVTAPPERNTLSRAFSRGPTTPRGPVDAAAPADAEVSGGSPAHPAARAGHSATGAPSAAGLGTAGVSSQVVVGPSTSGAGAAGATKKKKASEMTKAERRALQEEQRAQKNAAKAPVDPKSKGIAPKAKSPQVQESENQKGRGQAREKNAVVDRSEGGPAGSLAIFSHLPPHLRMTAQVAVKKSDVRIQFVTTKRSIESKLHWIVLSENYLLLWENHALPNYSKKLHPAILELGLAYSDGTIKGSSARSIAMMLAMRCVVRDYAAPPTQAFSRALTAHINACVGFLWDECRPACVPQRNSIKWLKSTIHNVPPSEADESVRMHILKAMDNFVNEKFIFAEQMVVRHACDKIESGDVIVTYGHSKVVQDIFLNAKKQRKDFKVMVVDARPEISGERLACTLLSAGIKCSHMALDALTHMIKSATKVMLGASAVKSNGAAVARAGSALVAMASANARKPVLICAQSIKFHDEVQLESITSNEQGDPLGILTVRNRPEITASLTASNESGKLSVLNLVYDVMPIDFITLIVTEFGLIPPTSVPVILREKRDDEPSMAGS